MAETGRGRWVFGAAAALVVAASLAFAAVIQYHPLGGPATTAIDDIGEAVAAFLAALACAYAARKAIGNDRLGWTLMAISAALWGIGESIWSVYEVGLGVDVPYPSPADAGFLASVPFAFAGIRAFWSPPRGTATRWRVWLDAAIIAFSLTSIGWALGFRMVFTDPVQTLAEKAFDLAYPTADILVGTLLILAIRRATHQKQGRMFLLLGGVAAYAVADSTFSYLSATDSYGVLGNVLDTGWVVGYLLIALAAVYPGASSSRTADNAPVDLWQLALPWLTILAAGVTAIAMALTGHGLDPILTAIIGVIACLLTASVVLTHKDLLAMLTRSRVSEATLAEVVDRSPLGIVRADTSLKIIAANPRLGVMLGEPPGALLGLTFDRYIPAEVQPEVFQRLGALAAGQLDKVDGEFDMIRSDQTRIWTHWTSTVVKNGAGETDYYLIMLEDVEARHRADEAAKASLDALDRLNRLKTEFLQSVSHEFKTALTGIQGFSEFMRDADELDPNDARAFAADIHRDAERLDRMVTEMIDLDSVEMNRASLRRTSVDMNSLIAAEVGQMSPAASANVVLDLAPSLPTVSGDEEKLRDTVRTLLANAVKYSPEDGRITITTLGTDDTVTVSIRDEGVDARADFDNRLFGEGDLYANNPIRKVVGTGLGLAIVRQVVEMHGGRVWVDRIEGKGSEFHFTLQVAPVPALVVA
jgi:PAS domain S-box-containing protein